MKKFFTLGIAASLLLITVARMKAQDAQNPWHLIAFENEKEVAFYNTEVITGIEATEHNVTIVLESGKEFSHPIATTTFGFDPRKEGTATMNESITVSQWNVRYANGRLHFSETVNSITVYAVIGTLMAQFTGNHTEVSVNLASGTYIVQANGRSAKLFVNNGNGSAVSQPEIKTKTAVYAPTVPISLRSDSTINIYWNITANNSTTSIKISNVEKFYFKLDSLLVFELKGGGTVELSNYQGIEFTIEPVEPTPDTYWDLERTFAIGGGSYGFDYNLDEPMSYKLEYISAVSQTDIIIYDVASGQETKYSRNGIPDNLMNMDNAVISFYKDEYSALPVISYITFNCCIDLGSILPDSRVTWIRTENPYYSFNGGTNKIPTTFNTDKDGNLVATYFNADGVSRQHTFKK